MAEKSPVEKGNITIHTENIFPIIKKWLYSEKEIFLRELVANAVDAIHKLQHINVVEGLQLADDYAVDILVDEKAGTLTVRDNGIGMTAEEIRRYINQIAFSSAEEFIQRFQDLKDKNQLIGHFGLGFYSSFMVAKKVEIRSLSYRSGAAGAHWSCDGTTGYKLAATERASRGTEVILHLEADEKEFLNPVRLREVLKRYCNFLPVPIRLGGDVVNDRNPLWTKTPSEVGEEEYKEFYGKLYPFSEDPLFWIHLNVDFPFNLKGILYFPKLNTEFDVTRSHIKLFCNQVFVSDNCPELIPEFLTPLQGCLDAPDLPLNVSRSYLQNEPQVRKIQEVIAGRVAGKVVELAKKEDRETFGRIWEDIHTFVKYGMMRDEKFFDKVKDQVIYRSTGENRYTTLPEYLERARARHADKVFYTNDEAAQATYLKLFQSQGLEVLILDNLIDSHFIQYLEMKNTQVKFERVDADVSENLIEDDRTKKLVEGEDQKTVEEKIREAFEKALDVKGLSIRVESLKDGSVPAMILLPEQSRRFKEMTRMMRHEVGEADALFSEHTLLVNSSSPVVKNIVKMTAGGPFEDAGLLARHVYDLAMLTHQAFDREKMEGFLERSNRILEMLSKK
jgi:molecular chaperone HtpG